MEGGSFQEKLLFDFRIKSSIVTARELITPGYIKERLLRPIHDWSDSSTCLEWCFSTLRQPVMCGRANKLN
ncbi:hypothetical protein Bca4012_089453 [Brassica carinata]